MASQKEAASAVGHPRCLDHLTNNSLSTENPFSNTHSSELRGDVSLDEVTGLLDGYPFFSPDSQQQPPYGVPANPEMKRPAPSDSSGHSGKSSATADARPKKRLKPIGSGASASPMPTDDAASHMPSVVVDLTYDHTPHLPVDVAHLAQLPDEVMQLIAPPPFAPPAPPQGGDLFLSVVTSSGSGGANGPRAMARRRFVGTPVTGANSSPRNAPSSSAFGPLSTAGGHAPTPSAFDAGGRTTPSAFDAGGHAAPSAFDAGGHAAPSAFDAGGHATPSAFDAGVHATPSAFDAGVHAAAPSAFDDLFARHAAGHHATAAPLDRSAPAGLGASSSSSLGDWAAPPSTPRGGTYHTTFPTVPTSAVGSSSSHTAPARQRRGGQMDVSTYTTLQQDASNGSAPTVPSGGSTQSASELHSTYAVPSSAHASAPFDAAPLAMAHGTGSLSPTGQLMRSLAHVAVNGQQQRSRAAYGGAVPNNHSYSHFTANVPPIPYQPPGDLGTSVVANGSPQIPGYSHMSPPTSAPYPVPQDLGTSVTVNDFSMSFSMDPSSSLSRPTVAGHQASTASTTRHAPGRGADATSGGTDLAAATVGGYWVSDREPQSQQSTSIMPSTRSRQSTSSVPFTSNSRLGPVPHIYLSPQEQAALARKKRASAPRAQSTSSAPSTSSRNMGPQSTSSVPSTSSSSSKTGRVPHIYLSPQEQAALARKKRTSAPRTQSTSSAPSTSSSRKMGPQSTSSVPSTSSSSAGPVPHIYLSPQEQAALVRKKRASVPGTQSTSSAPSTSSGMSSSLWHLSPQERAALARSSGAPATSAQGQGTSGGRGHAFGASPAGSLAPSAPGAQPPLIVTTTPAWVNARARFQAKKKTPAQTMAAAKIVAASYVQNGAKAAALQKFNIKNGIRTPTTAKTIVRKPSARSLKPPPPPRAAKPPTKKAAAKKPPAKPKPSIIVRSLRSSTDLDSTVGSSVPPYKPWENWPYDMLSADPRTDEVRYKRGEGSRKTEVITISTGTPHGKQVWNEVAKHFFNKKTKREYDIVSIEAVCNPRRYDGYMSFREEVAELAGIWNINERWVWHGTSKATAEKIVHQGFLRQFGERAMFGKGVYFAESSSYSVRRRYAPCDEDGNQRLLLCRMVCGEYHEGREDLLQPLPKKRMVDGKVEVLKHEPHESTCDKVRAPSIWVAYSDNQALLEFIVTYRWKGLDDEDST